VLNFISQASKAKRKVIFKRAESYVKEYLAKEKDEIRLKRAARTAGDFYVPAQPKVYFVVRIRGYACHFPIIYNAY
jgi:large subunit ribosomal protein L7e